MGKETQAGLAGLPEHKLLSNLFGAPRRGRSGGRQMDQSVQDALQADVWQGAIGAVQRSDGGPIGNRGLPEDERDPLACSLDCARPPNGRGAQTVVWAVV